MNERTFILTNNTKLVALHATLLSIYEVLHLNLLCVDCILELYLHGTYHYMYIQFSHYIITRTLRDRRGLEGY